MKRTIRVQPQAGLGRILWNGGLNISVALSPPPTYFLGSHGVGWRVQDRSGSPCTRLAQLAGTVESLPGPGKVARDPGGAERSHEVAGGDG
jgi:hypothetical protein